MKRIALTALAMFVVLSCASWAGATVYSGSLSYDPPAPPNSSDGLFVAQGAEVQNQWPTYTVGITWTVTNEDTSHPGFPWKYTYTFGHNGTQGGISHVIIEASDTFTSSDYVGLTGAAISSIDEQRITSGNPGMPADMYGIRFDPDPAVEGVFSMTWSFWSDRDPVWGDFYARCGNFHNAGVNRAYNYNDTLGTELGFLASDSDPTGPAASGSLDYHILVPDTVPEPTTLALLALGGLVLARRRH